MRTFGIISPPLRAFGIGALLGGGMAAVMLAAIYVFILHGWF